MEIGEGSSSSSAAGLMAVLAVSGGVAFLAFHLHNRLLSNFNLQLLALKNSSQGGPVSVKKGAARFTAGRQTTEYYYYYYYSGERRWKKGEDGVKLTMMPLNWQVMYKARLDYHKFTPTFH